MHTFSCAMKKLLKQCLWVIFHSCSTFMGLLLIFDTDCALNSMTEKPFYQVRHWGKKKYAQQFGGVSAYTSVTLVQWHDWCIPHLVSFYKLWALGFRRKRDYTDGYSNKCLRRLCRFISAHGMGNSAYENSIDAQRPIQVVGLTCFPRMSLVICAGQQGHREKECSC